MTSKGVFAHAKPMPDVRNRCRRCVTAVKTKVPPSTRHRRYSLMSPSSHGACKHCTLPAGTRHLARESCSADSLSRIAGLPPRSCLPATFAVKHNSSGAVHTAHRDAVMSSRRGNFSSLAPARTLPEQREPNQQPLLIPFLNPALGKRPFVDQHVADYRSAIQFQRKADDSALDGWPTLRLAGRVSSRPPRKRSGNCRARVHAVVRLKEVVGARNVKRPRSWSRRSSTRWMRATPWPKKSEGPSDRNHLPGPNFRLRRREMAIPRPWRNSTSEASELPTTTARSHIHTRPLNRTPRRPSSTLTWLSRSSFS